MKAFSYLIIALLFILGSVTQITAQGKLGKVGKIFSVEEANALFGEVKSSKTINTKFLRNVLNKSKHYVRMKMKRNMMTIFEDTFDVESFNRKHKITAITVDDSPEHIFSKETIKELIDLGGSDVTIIQDRGEVLTVTNGAYTLEFAVGCPPFCW